MLLTLPPAVFNLRVCVCVHSVHTLQQRYPSHIVSCVTNAVCLLLAF